MLSLFEDRRKILKMASYFTTCNSSEGKMGEKNIFGISTNLNRYLKFRCCPFKIYLLNEVTCRLDIINQKNFGGKIIPQQAYNLPIVKFIFMTDNLLITTISYKYRPGTIAFSSLPEPGG